MRLFHPYVDTLQSDFGHARFHFSFGHALETGEADLQLEPPLRHPYRFVEFQRSAAD